MTFCAVNAAWYPVTGLDNCTDRSARMKMRQRTGSKAAIGLSAAGMAGPDACRSEVSLQLRAWLCCSGGPPSPPHPMRAQTGHLMHAALT